MRNIALKCSYIGTKYHGFQIQNNAVTVCSVMQDTLKGILGEDILVKGSSRTDAGVHAEGFVLCVYTDSGIPCTNLLRAMNSRLPSDIAVLNAVEVDQDFHPRYSALGKKYVYRILSSKVKNPFLHDRAWHYNREIFIEKILQGSDMLKGKHDFKGFSSKSSIDDTVRTIFDISVKRLGDILEIWVYGDGFLYNMVRIIVGTLIGLSEGTLCTDDILEILSSGDRRRAGITAPAHGLYLHSVIYKDDPFK